MEDTDDKSGSVADLGMGLIRQRPKCMGSLDVPGAPAVLRELLQQNAGVAASYWILAVLVKEYFSRYQMWPAPLWLPAGVAMFAAFSMGPRCWPGILLGSFLTDTITFGEPGYWAAVSFGNTIAPIVAAEFVRDRFGLERPFAR